MKIINDILSFIPRSINHRKWLQTEASRLKAFHDIHREEDCFLIGNGPSLNKMDLKVLNDYYTIGLNKIFLLFERTGLNIDYHVCVNRLVIEQCTKDFLKMDTPSFISYKNRNESFEKSNRIFFVGDVHSGWKFFEDITTGISQGSTVTFTAMQIAFYMGFSRVFLIGVDHSFADKGTPHKAVTMKGDDVNHFDPDYFKGMKWHLPDLEGSERAYRLAKVHFEKHNRNIMDATVDGKLTVFPKISFEDALNIAKKKIKPS
ncbi:MAG: DUF115 domain-containing protein [Bacteroidales bacterium]|nr:DUF115 domain-containing protein [Bacteroidales bacterium]